MATTNNMFTLTVDEKISRAKVQLYTKAPFFSYLIEHMTIYEESDPKKLRVPTMGVNAKNDLFYNPDFVDKLPDEELLGVLCHEVMHCALEHPWRGDGRNIVIKGKNTKTGEVHDLSLWNAAIDIVVNGIILKNGFRIPKDCILPDIAKDSIEIFGGTINELSNKSAEEIYDELKQLVKDQIQKSKGKGKKGKGQPSDDGDEGSTVIDMDGELGFDQHDFDDPEDGQGKGKDGKEQEGGGQGKDWKQIMSDAATFSKQRGIDPLGLGRDYDVGRKSCINWRAILRREIAKSIPVDYTWARPSRKFMSQGIYLPSTQSEEVKVLFAVDLSGSVSREELSMYMAEIISIANVFPGIEMHVLTHDAILQDDFHITTSTKSKLKALEVHGGGGTDMIPVHKYIHDKGYDKGYAILIHLTDGYGSFPDKPVLPTYIVLSASHCPKETLPRWSKGNIPLTA